MIAPPLRADLELPAPFAAVAFVRVLFHSQQARVAHALQYLCIPRYDRAALTGGDVLDAVEGKAGYIAEATDLPIPIAATEGMCRIFDDTQSMLAREGVNPSRSPT